MSTEEHVLKGRACAGSIALLTCCVAVLSGSDSCRGEDPFPLVTERVESWVRAGFYPGCSVWIAQGDRVLYERSFGSHNPDTEVYIASAGKWLVAATILALVDEGRLSLDDPVGSWLPEFRNDPKGKARLRELLSHTSGFPPYQPDDKPTDNYQTCEESVRHLLPLPPLAAPGQQFAYGGLAMQAAGRMAEAATGLAWEAIFREKIAGPLGMTRTRFSPVDPGHTPMLAGGAVSTMHDYSRFLTMVAGDGVFKGRRILSAEAVREMEADQVRGARVSRGEFVERRRGRTHPGLYGLGIWREELDTQGRAVLISSPSWAGTYPWIDKAHDIRGLIIAHVGPKAGSFSGFWTSPVLMNLVRAEIEWQFPRSLPGYTAGTIRANGADIAYEAAGSGEPLILLHGHSFDRRMWDPQFAELAKHHRVIRYDLRGYGLSDLPVEGRDTLHADDLLALMDGLKIPRAHIAGLSLGAFVVADFLALHPDRLLSATMASGAVFDGPAAHDQKERDRSSELIKVEEVRSKGVTEYKNRWRNALLQTPHSAAVSPLVNRMIGDWSAWQLLQIEPRLLLGKDALAKIKESAGNVPTLWIAGASDKQDKSIAAFSSILPGMQLVVLENAGHLCSIEKPDEFTRALLGFLAGASGTQGSH